MEPVEKEIEKLANLLLERRLPPAVLGGNSAEVVLRFVDEERKVINFCSNNYLGLATDRRLLEALVEGIERYGFAGATASRLVIGNFEAHEFFEERVRRYFGLDDDWDVLFFNSGWCANVGVISALAFSDEWEIFSDSLNHASIIDGCRLSRAKVSVYPHCDLDRLELMLKSSKAKWKLVVTDSLFSMDGDFAPLDEIFWLCRRWGAYLYVDEAHAFGVFGEGGRGVARMKGVKPDVSLFTLSKSAGLFGAFVVARKDVVRFLRSRARSFIFATALPPYIAWAGAKAIEILEGADDRRAKLKENFELMKKLLNRFYTVFSPSQIIPFVVGGEREVLEISRKLFDSGFFVQAIRPPSVPRGTSRLRITCTSAHTPEQIKRFVDCLFEIWKEVLREKL